MVKIDWHSADIIAGLHKRGTTMAAVSRAAGLNSSTLGNTLIRPWPKGEQLIAEALGVPAYEIWPSRYFDEQGQLIPRTPRSRPRYTQDK
ncbi:helix-turn-helix domain-containing protein [Dickeya dadantii]|uniref:helix-turn-helix domain-containing protein n=1 Tax=Dickeya dadantii TaxID=204038 RepID=UPI00149564A9|nr:helix-turn-helix transcriptional regulator [Dickeya dadantii]NPE55498.1 helix-turn-helix domain-containing protein [Dickeya dadantii]NPE65561.1 helix-turn-helix domain-containing protein [Dickeya dadantii]